MKKFFISNTIKRIAYWNAGVMLGLYLTLLIFTLVLLNLVLIDDVDSRLSHEVEHVFNTIATVGDSITVIHPEDLLEPDLRLVTENPFFLQIYDLEGNLFLQSENLKFYEKILLGFPNNFSPYYFESFIVKNEHIRTIYKPLYNSSNKHIGYMQLSTFHASFNRVLVNIFWFNIILLPIIVLVIIFLSIFLAKKSYNPINRIIDLSNSISATNLSKRLDYNAEPDDELGKLKNTLNSLFERLEDQIKEISQFTDNASHQLMTPLTAIKTELDYILKRDHTVEEYRDTCKILKDQADRMIVMVKTMLIMSRGCSDCTDNNNVFNFSKLLNDEIKNIYSSSSVQFEVEKNIYLRGKSEYFSTVVENLISNSIKYSPSDSIIYISAKKENNKLIFRVIDNGIGIADKEKLNIFKRFYRIDTDDVNRVNGYGLGLSLVKSVTESMGGTIKILDNKPTGCIFEIQMQVLELY